MFASDGKFVTTLVGDQLLFSRLRQLGAPRCDQPLVEITGDPSSMRTCNVTLTDVGRAVLQGRVNAVRLKGIDDWVLGVHLSSRLGTVWYQEDGMLKM